SFLADVALPVQFDDETGSRTVEVRDVTGDWCLPAELEPSESTAAQMGPKAFFGRRRLATEFARSPRPEFILLHEVCSSPHPQPLSLQGRGEQSAPLSPGGRGAGVRGISPARLLPSPPTPTLPHKGGGVTKEPRPRA